LTTTLSARDLDDGDLNDDDKFEYARVRRRRRRRAIYDDDEEEYDEDVMSAADRLEEDGIFNDDDDDDEFDDEIKETFANVLIPNPVLDNIDPDGAAERFPELARDAKFWFELVLFLIFLDFLSFIGPRNPFPDLPEILSNAQLPPPGM
jgi:hypothetical protein